MNLDELRKRINELDRDLVNLLNARSQAVLEIGRLKNRSGGEIYVPEREREVLDRVTTFSQGPLPAESVRAIYREIMSASIALERPVKIAYLGPPATFTHQAARARFGVSVDYRTCDTISDVFSEVTKRNADYGVVPIENSTEGAVTHTLDQFADTALKICAEIYLPISLHLMATDPAVTIRKIYSKAEVFGQCRHWLQDNMPHDIELIPVSSTSRAAEMASSEPGSAALASHLAAEMYNLEVIAQNVQDFGGNTTRFLVIAKSHGRATGHDKTSIVFGLRHEAGTLHRALFAFAEHGINMMKIESRPSKTKVWEYFFFVDVEGHVDDEFVRKSLEKLQEQCTVMTVLGSYPRAAGREG